MRQILTFPVKGYIITIAVYCGYNCPKGMIEGVLMQISRINEIYLSRLVPAEENYRRTAEALGVEKLSDAEELEQVLRSSEGQAEYSIYISNEEKECPSADEITGVFRKCSAEENGIKVTVTSEEFLNLVDSASRLTEDSKPRSLVHRDGDLHPAVHVWIIKRRDMGVYVLLQKRADKKDTDPGCYDVSVAGHLSQGNEFRSAAVRETAEELGIKIHGSQLRHIGNLNSHTVSDGIDDNEYVAVYIYREPVDENSITLQQDEVSEVCWAEVDELLAVMDDADFPNCIDVRELVMIKKAVF